MIIEYEAGNDVAEEEEILIMGEFNQWLPEPMRRVEGKPKLFEFEVDVFNGFKYRYQYIVNGEIVIDANQPHSESKLGRLTNYKIAENTKLPTLALDSNVPSYVFPSMSKLTGRLES